LGHLPSHRPNRNNNSNNGGCGGRGGSGNNRGGRGRNRGRGGGRGGRSHHHQQGSWQQPQAPQHQWAYPLYQYFPWNAQWQPLAFLPCPYPTTGNWQRPVVPNRQLGILGAKQQQARVAATQSSYARKDIQADMHTSSVAPPDKQWYIYTR